LFDADIRGYIQSLKDWENSDISSVMYSLADRALYEAKENGRNRCKQCDFRQIPDYSDA